MRITRIDLTGNNHHATIIQLTYASGRGDAIILSGRILVVAEEDADRLDAAGISFAYLIDHDLPNGKNVVVTIPVNDEC